jgi:probable phosphoglycerate mutase
MTRLVWLVRHGASTAPPGVAIGSSDLPLSDVGMKQAEALAQELAARPLAAVYASDLRRARTTAQAIARPHRLPVTVDPRVRELDFGGWEGRNLADLWVEEPDAAARWERDVRMTPPSFMESVADLEARVAQFWSQVSASGNDEVAVVAHRGSLAVLRTLLTGEVLDLRPGSGFELGTATAVSAVRELTAEDGRHHYPAVAVRPW